MAGIDGYSVGNLKLAFTTLDQTSDDFKKLATNLRAIVNLINRISTADLGKFTANVKEITKAFNPFLTRLEKSTAGLQAFDSVARQIGVRNISNVVQAFDEIQKATRKTAKSAAELNDEIENRQGNARQSIDATNNSAQKLFETLAQSSKPELSVYEDIKNTRAEIERTENKLKELQQEFLNVYSASDDEEALLPPFEAVQKEIEQTENRLSGLRNKLSELQLAFSMSFNAAQAEVSKLTQEMLNLHFKTSSLNDSVISQIVEQTNKITASRKAVEEAISAKQREKMSEEELKIALQNETIAQYNAANAERKRLISYYEAKIATAQAGENVKEYRKELERLRKEDGQAGKKSWIQKFLGQIKRVAIYRLIRSGLKAVTSAFKDGITALAQFDSGINKTMSQLNTSFTVMKLSVSMALVPLLESITPIIQQISVGFANMANVISASMSKTGYYTKINTDRLLAYNKAANLFDFDKFRALNKGDDAMNLLSTEKVEDFNDELGSSKLLYSGIFDIIKSIGEILRGIISIVLQIFNVASPILGVLAKVLGFVLKIVGAIINFVAEIGLIEPILYGILGVLTLIGISKIVTWIQNEGITKAITSLSTALKKLPVLLSNIEKAVNTTMGKFVLWGVAIAAVTAAVKILSNWDDFSRGTKIAITAISTLVAVLTSAAIAAMYLQGALTMGVAVPLIITAGAAGAVAIGGAIKGYANGGLPDKGSMFVAGESGAEFVYNMPSGQSGVANIQQIAQAVYQGTYQATMDWWKSAKNEIGGDVYLDGEKIYQNTTSRAKKHGQKWATV